MVNLSKRVPLSFALALFLTVAAGSGGLWFAGESLDTFQTDVLQRVADERATAALESHFKTQVQEWKNTLLRGSDATLLTKHWAAFQKEEKAVADGADALLVGQSDPQLPGLLKQFIAAHKKMATGYRDGLEKFQGAGLEASVGDTAVRGIDREPAKLLEDLGRQIAERSSKVAESAYANGRRAKYWGMGLMTLASVLGLGIGFVLSRSVVTPLRRATQVAADVAGGNLGQEILARGTDETAALMRTLGSMQDQLRRLVGSVRENAESVATASAQIAQGNQDLSQRTEQQASALQQTAATMDELGAPVRTSADSARQANQLAQGASAAAVNGSDVVGRVVSTRRTTTTAYLRWRRCGERSMGVRDHRRLKQTAPVVRGALFDLKRAVMNRKTFRQGPRDAVHCDVARIAVRHHEMHGQGALGGAHAPDVQVVQILHAGQ